MMSTLVHGRAQENAHPMDRTPLRGTGWRVPSNRRRVTPWTRPQPLTAEAIRARVDELLAAMTPEEKAGQLTQYFYFGGLPEPDPPAELSNAEQAARAEARDWRAARSGRCCS